MRRALPWVLVFALALAHVLRSPGRSHEAHAAPAPLPVGTVIVVARPTGEVVAGKGGGNPQPVYESVTLRVALVRGSPDPVPPGERPWRVTLGEHTYVCVCVPE
jgi:hypothetical protein